MKIQNVIWDFDGTLFDTYPFMTKIVQEVLLTFGFTEAYSKIFSEIKISFDNLSVYCENKYGISKLDLNRKYEKLTALAPLDAVKPFDGIPQLLKKISDNRGKNFVFTHRGKSAAAMIEYYGLSHFFDDIVSSGITGIEFKRKPEPDGNNYIINKYGLDRSSTIAIGDRCIDILAAKRAGIYSCMFTEHSTNALCESDFAVDDFGELDCILL